jgi:hypothetical protein
MLFTARVIFRPATWEPTEADRRIQRLRRFTLASKFGSNLRKPGQTIKYSGKPFFASFFNYRSTTLFASPFGLFLPQRCELSLIFCKFRADSTGTSSPLKG